ncbi:MAG: hypothetical protein M3Z70_05570, partial [Bartonella sp.]|nr:hypothetical protein [Bartonella sp.]
VTTGGSAVIAGGGTILSADFLLMASVCSGETDTAAAVDGASFFAAFSIGAGWCRTIRGSDAVPVHASSDSTPRKMPYRFINAPLRFIKSPFRFIKSPLRFINFPLNFIKFPLDLINLNV